MATAQTGSRDEYAIDVQGLTFAFQGGEPVLEDINLQLKPGDRCLLVGANGAGKSTLLQILAGKRMTRTKTRVLGQDVFFNTPIGVTYLGTEWAANPVVRSDVVVSHFLDSVGGYRHTERRDRLLEILDVDLDWHMHQISDGERRRVQIVQGLMAPWDVLLLDEVTVDLDVLVRSSLLAFLREESVTRGATILYATHIFDGLDGFPTLISHLFIGKTPQPTLTWPIKDAAEAGIDDATLARMDDPNRSGSKLMELALEWLKRDKKERARLEKEEGRKERRPAKSADVPNDSEAFYRKYDYSN